MVRIPLIVSMLLYWTALPPVGGWLLAFIVPFLWCMAIRSDIALKRQSELQTRKWHQRPVGFWFLWSVAYVFWLATVWWISCPHWATILGLFALAAYLAVYLPAFFFSTSFAVSRLRCPILIAAPVCWVGCEYFKNHLLGGFNFAALEHALYLQPRFLQIADLGGQYAVAGLLVFVGAGIATLWPTEPQKTNANRLSNEQIIAGFLSMTLLLVAALYKAKEKPNMDDEPLTVAALQGNLPVTLFPSPDFARKSLDMFFDLTREAIRQSEENGKPLDLIIWPETVCPVSLILFENGVTPEDAGYTSEEIETNNEYLYEFAERVKVPIIIGLSAVVFDDPLRKENPRRYNSALFFGNGKDPAAVERYDKVNLVMFGEYIPFSSYLPDGFFLKTLCQEAGAGKKPVLFGIKTGASATVNICFESSLPQYIVAQIKRFSFVPTFLINMSNDGWFRFSSQNELHLATYVFRAIENRRSFVAASNGGYSAIIDSTGKIQKLGTKRAAEVVIGEVYPPTESITIYHHIGDFPAFVCAALVLVLLCGATIFRRDERYSGV